MGGTIVGEENHDGLEPETIFVMTDKVNLFSGVAQVK